MIKIYRPLFSIDDGITWEDMEVPSNRQMLDYVKEHGWAVNKKIASRMGVKFLQEKLAVETEEDKKECLWLLLCLLRKENH